LDILQLIVQLIEVLRQEFELFPLMPHPPSQNGQMEHLLLSSQFWPMWSKSRQGFGQLPIGRSTLSGWMIG